MALGARTNSEQLAGRCCFSARRCPAKSVFCQCTKDISYIWSITLGRYSTETTTRRTSNHNEDMVPRMSSLPNAQSKSESVANGTDMIDRNGILLGVSCIDTCINVSFPSHGYCLLIILDIYNLLTCSVIDWNWSLIIHIGALHVTRGNSEVTENRKYVARDEQLSIRNINK